MRYLVIAALVLIVASLFSAMYYMMHDRGGSRRMVRALALRVGLSLALFLLLMASYYLGWIEGRL
ncbi:MAG: twin transmembrane helix small protein [Pseudomonadota bacterium]